jgi:hypothetical protein
MPRSRPLQTALALLAAWLPLPSLSAATHTVLPDTSIQAKIDLAQPGDIVAILGGAYDQDITITKAIRLVEADGQDVTITGNITFSGVTNAPPFVGFTVGAAGKQLTVTDTTGLVLKNIDGGAGATLKTSGASKVSLIRSVCTGVQQQGGELTIVQSTVNGYAESTITAQKTVMLRTTMQDVFVRSKKAWVGYSSARTLRADGEDTQVIIVGCRFHRDTYDNSMTLLGDDSRYLVANCNFTAIDHGPSAPGWGIVVWSNGTVDIINNHISMGWSQVHQFSNIGTGVLIGSTTAKVRILNNILGGCYHDINAPFGTTVRNNFMYKTLSIIHGYGGHVPVGTLRGEPLFFQDQAPKLQPASPCINAGIADPNFNDLDGSRNDIGPGGGCFFDPDGWTTDKPVVIAFDLGPPQLLQGTDTEVTLSNGQAVSQD